MSTKKEQIQSKAIEILKNNPQGVRYSKLLKEINVSLPNIPINTIQGTIWNLDAIRPNEVYKAGKGLFRHVSFKGTQIVSPSGGTPQPCQINEADFYASFAGYLENDLEECTKAIPLGGSAFQDKWGTPDVIGIKKSKSSDIVKHEPVITSAEIKTNTLGSELITAFGQACAYTTFSHKTYIVVPKNASGMTLTDWSHYA